MTRGALFFAGMTKTVLRSTLQQQLKSHALGEVFEDMLISDLIAQKHYYCSINRLRPTHFRKLPRTDGGYDFQGLFGPYKWHGVSWTQCLAPRDQNGWIEAALRMAVKPFLSARRQAFPVCERCALTPSTEVDHVESEFNEIFRRAMNIMSADEFQEAFSRFDWWSHKPFLLPEDNSALVYTLATHATAKLQAVCKSCHKLNDAERKAARQAKPR
ncbi:MAG: hypothetical protein JWP42_2227 [Pseudomonas sp.]|nr:hypothetical protein [Pseudomonas sp.]